MDQKAVINFCKELGCCDACCLRYLGIKTPSAYENSHKYIEQILGKAEDDAETTNTAKDENGSPPAKKMKTGDVCTSCLGILQEDTWNQSFDVVKEVLEKKRYDCTTFAGALSPPMCTILREKVITLRLAEAFKDYNQNAVLSLKEAWKWSMCIQLATYINMSSDSGAHAPLLLTLHLDYPDDLQELEVLKQISPSLFEYRSRQKRRFAVEFTRRSVEEALAKATVVDATRVDLTTAGRVRCVSVDSCANTVILGGRYQKLSRSLPQTPWLVNGKRMMHSSVQELIFEPIASVFGLSPEEVEHKLKFISAGREDVDVRCLGDGRPFAIEVTDPRRQLTEKELNQICEDISSSGKVTVKELVYVSRNSLTQLKKGEETKSKSYDALCIKLSHSIRDLDSGISPSAPVHVTSSDLELLNKTSDLELSQRTPIRVLHRRPLLTRTRRIDTIEARAVEGYPQLFTIHIQCSAGTYVKEWVHGELGRTKPALRDLLGCSVDILALDVTKVHLDWPVKSA